MAQQNKAMTRMMEAAVKVGQKTAAAKARVRHHLQSHKHEYKSTGAAAMGGASAAAVSGFVFPESVKSSYWWAEPATYLVTGHFLSKKYPNAGHGMAGVAGYLFAKGMMRTMNVNANVTGYDDASAYFQNAGDAAAAMDGSIWSQLQQGASGAEESQGIDAAALVEAFQNVTGPEEASAGDAYDL